MDNADQEIDTKQEELRRKKQEKLLAKKAAAREAQNQLYRVSGFVFCLGSERHVKGGLITIRHPAGPVCSIIQPATHREE